jgi:ribonuclease BN (tRNA processing enzyme)
LAKGAAVLVYDSQFTVEEYEGRSGGISHRGWGHSTWVHGLKEAAAAGVKRLLLTHHDPWHDDWDIARLENEARREGARKGIQVDAVQEGMEIEL